MGFKPLAPKICEWLIVIVLIILIDSQTTRKKNFSATDTSLDKTASYQASLGGKNLLVNLGN